MPSELYLLVSMTFLYRPSKKTRSQMQLAAGVRWRTYADINDGSSWLYCRNVVLILLSLVLHKMNRDWLNGGHKDPSSGIPTRCTLLWCPNMGLDGNINIVSGDGQVHYTLLSRQWCHRFHMYSKSCMDRFGGRCQLGVLRLVTIQCLLGPYLILCCSSFPDNDCDTCLSSTALTLQAYR